MEFITPIPTWLDMNECGAELFQAFRDPQRGRKLLIDENAFIERLLPSSIVRELLKEEMDAYRHPFLIPASREPFFASPTNCRSPAPARSAGRRTSPPRLIRNNPNGLRRIR